MITGLLGAHRVGKTTLARHYAEKTGVLFIETSVSSVFREFGVEASTPMDFTTRLNIQERILERLEEQYRSASLKHGAITDRTPLDMMAYTLANAANDEVPADQQERLAKYVDKCFEVTNKYFGVLVLVQPGIPVVEAEGKAANSLAYMHLLNFILRGLMDDDRLQLKGYCLKNTSLDLERRFTALDFCVKRSVEKAEAELVALREEKRQTN